MIGRPRSNSYSLASVELRGGTDLGGDGGDNPVVIPTILASLAGRETRILFGYSLDLHKINRRCEHESYDLHNFRSAVKHDFSDAVIFHGFSMSP